MAQSLPDTVLSLRTRSCSEDGLNILAFTVDSVFSVEQDREWIAGLQRVSGANWNTIINSVQFNKLNSVFSGNNVIPSSRSCKFFIRY